MGSGVLAKCAVVACLALGVGTVAKSASEHAAAVAGPRLIEYAADGGKFQSLLVLKAERAGARWTSVTRVQDGARLLEEATLNPEGRLVRAQSILSCPSGHIESVVLDARAGVVETRTQEGVSRHAVPTDLPWTWVPRGCPNGDLETLATPLAALVTLRGGASDETRRLVDLRSLESHTIMADQLIVREDASSEWVVVGDDAILVAADLTLNSRAR